MGILRLPEKIINTANVSVIIPAYRAANTIGRALYSVARQTMKPLEVIVVDDGSDDSTTQAAESGRVHMNGIELKIINQGHKGAGAARNRAVSEATSEYIALLDADDEWMEQKIERSMAILKETNSLLVAHDYTRIQSNGQEIVIDCTRRFKAASDPFVGLYRQGFICTSTAVISRQAVLAAGGFDETLATAQDFDLWLKALGEPGANFIIFPETLTRYHLSEGSITTFTERRLACSLRIAVRHFPRLVGRSGSALTSLCYRVAAVHYEAVSAYRQAAKPMAALGAALALPWRLLWAIMNTPGSSRPASDWLTAFLLLWVVVGAGAYVYQVQHLGRAFLNMVSRL